MILSTCPTDQDLRQYAIGDSGDDLCLQIEEHLRVCPTCENTIAQFDFADDTLTRHLPLVLADRVASPASAPLWLERLRKWGQEPTENESPVGQLLPAPVPAERLANYELLGILGQGGMGVVYLARHKQLNRRVALKVLSPRLLAAPEAQQRFQREIQLLGRLSHPGIVMATDAGMVASGAYLVMELIDGADLAQIVRETGPLSVGEACEVGRQLAEALTAAHAAGAIHRDVKPSNVMIDRERGRVRLLDFGLARLELSLLESGETSLGHLLGTLDYMAPEQSEGAQAVDNRADLYGLGATLFYLLTGRPPHGSHTGRSMIGYLRMIATELAPRIRTLRLDIPEELDEFIARLLSHRPEQRPVCAMDTARALARWAAGDLAARTAEIPSRSSLLEKNSERINEAERSLSALLGRISLSALKGESVAAAQEKAGLPTRRSWTWLTLIGAATAVVMFGVTILLDTPQGTLRIESDVDNVQVELVNDQNQIRELRIEPGETEKTTKLRAGPYRITLSGKHDGLSVDKDTVTLRRGKETVARITRSTVQDDHTVSPSQLKPASAGPVLPASGRTETKLVERLYQGKPESEWQRLFYAETEPKAKLVAAEALLKLAAVLPDAQNIDRILDVGQQIVQASFGSDPIGFAVQDQTNPLIHAPRWPVFRDNELQVAYKKFQKVLTDQIRPLQGDQLAETLSETIAKQPEPRAAFAYSLLNFSTRKSIRENPAAVKILFDRLNVRSTGLDRSVICLLARFQFINQVSAEDRQAAFLAMNELVVLLQKSPQSSVNDGLDRGLRDSIRSAFDSGEVRDLPPGLVKSLARLTLRNVLERRSDILYMTHPKSNWSDTLESYDQPAIAYLRQRTWFCLNGWVSVANEYLEQHPTRHDMVAEHEVVKLLGILSYAYTDGDDWPIQKSAEILTQRLRVAYAEPTDQSVTDLLPESAAVLLTQIVRATSQIPDFVRSGRPQVSSVARRLSQLERLLDGKVEVGPNNVYWKFDELKGLLDDAPYETIRLAVGEHKLPKNTQIILRGLAVTLDPIELLYVTSSLNDDRNNRRGPPTDPILLLVALADLTGVSELQDERIALFFADVPGKKIVLRQQLENILSSKLKARDVVLSRLREMTAKSKHQKLIDAIRTFDLAPLSTKQRE